MSSSNIKKKVFKGIIWQGLEKIGSYGMGFVVSVILARLLPTEEFGIIAIMMVFITLSNVFVDSGFSTALIQKKDMEQVDSCSIFYINIILGLVLYVILFLASPWIAKYYETEVMTLYLRILSIVIIIKSFSIIQYALLRKKMLFDLSFRISWAAVFVSGIVGISMAYCGFGIWSLIAQQITNSVVNGVMLWFWVKWRPQWMFDWNRTKIMFRFGWKVFCSTFLDTLYNDLYSITIGKIANLSTLSYYDRGRQYPRCGMDVINSTIAGVFLPAFSELQDEKKKIKELAARGLKNIFFVVTPILAFLFVFADSIIILILTTKWLPSAIFMRLCCIMFFFGPFHMINIHIMMACGRSDILLLLEIIKKIQGIIVIAITFRFGVVTMVTAGVVLELVVMIENSWYNKKLIDYAPWQQLWDVLPVVAITIFVSLASYLITISIQNVATKVLAGFIIFALLYLFAMLFLKNIPDEIKKIIPINAINRK